MKEIKKGDKGKSKITGKEGIIQATYTNGLYLLFTGNNYEHLRAKDIELQGN